MWYCLGSYYFIWILISLCCSVIFIIFCFSSSRERLLFFRVERIFFSFVCSRFRRYFYRSFCFRSFLCCQVFSFIWICRFWGVKGFSLSSFFGFWYGLGLVRFESVVIFINQVQQGVGWEWGGRGYRGRERGIDCFWRVYSLLRFSWVIFYVFIVGGQYEVKVFLITEYLVFLVGFF